MAPYRPLVALVVIVGWAAWGAGAAWGWEPSVSLSAGAEPANPPVVAMGAGGRAVIAWSRRLDEEHSWLAVRLREPGTEWGPVRYVSRPEDGLNEWPAVAVANSGEAVVAWAAADRQVRVAEAPPGRAFGASVVVGSDAGFSPLFPFVALDGHGGAIVLWEESDERVHYAARPAGGAFGPEQAIADPPHFDIAEDPAYAAAADGEAVAAWIDRAGHVYATLRGAGSAFGAPQSLEPGNDSIGAVHVTMAPDGAAAVVWTTLDLSRGDFRTRVAVRAPGAAAFAPALTLSYGRNGGVPAFGPGDELTVVEQATLSPPFGDEGVWAFTRSARGADFSRQLVAPASLRTDWDPAVAYDDTGALRVVFQHYDDPDVDHTRARVLAEQRPAGGGFSGVPATIASADDVLPKPVLAVGPHGSALAAWVVGTFGLGPVFAADDGLASPAPPPQPGPAPKPAPRPSPVPAPTASPAPGRPRPASCHVPRLRGLTLQQARVRLRRHRCRLGNVSPTLRRRHHGRIVIQHPRAGARRPAGTRVSVVVSRRPRRPL